MRKKFQILLSVMLSMIIVFTLSIEVKAADPRGDVGPYFNPYNWLEAEINFSHPEAATIEDDGRKVIKLYEPHGEGENAVYDYFLVKDVKLDKGLGAIDIKAKADEPALIEVHQGEVDGRLIGTLKINATDGIYATFTTPTVDAGGKTSYYFVCKSGSCYVDKWQAIPRDYSVVEDEPEQSIEEKEVQSANPPAEPFINPYNDVQAEFLYEKSDNVKVVEDNNGHVVSNITSGEYFSAKNVYFDKGVSKIQVLAKSDGYASFEIRKDSPNGELVGVISTARTNNPYTQEHELTYLPIEGNISSLEGLQTIYFVGTSGKVSVDVWHAHPLRNDGLLHKSGEVIYPYFNVEAELDYPRYNAEVTTRSTGKNVVNINGQGGYFTVENVDFNLGLSQISIYASSDKEAEIEIRDGAVDGEILANVELTSTNGQMERYDVNIPASKAIKGIHTLYFVSSKGSFAVDSWLANPGNEKENVQSEDSEQTDVSEQPDVSDGTKQPEVTEPEVAEPEVPVVVQSEKGLDTSYTFSVWNNGYQINFTLVNNSGKKINGWKLKIKKSEVVLDSSWCADVTEEGDYYVFSSPDWSYALDEGRIVEFGFTAKGNFKNSLAYEVE